MSKRIPKTITSFEHKYYLDEDVFKMVNELEEKNIDLEEYNAELMLCNSRFNAILTELEEWINSYIPLLDAGDIVEESSQDTLKEVLNKIQELKEKYK